MGDSDATLLDDNEPDVKKDVKKLRVSNRRDSDEWTLEKYEEVAEEDITSNRLDSESQLSEGDWKPQFLLRKGT